MKKTMVTMMMVSLIAISSLGFKIGNQKQQDGINASITRGKTVYTQYCLTCHQANAAGVPRMTPPLIKTQYVLGDKKQLITIVLKGLTGEIEVNDDVYNGTMPTLKALTDQQVADVLTFVRNSFGNKASAVSAAEVKSVRAKIKS